jgi:hypothetical protein
MVDITQPAGQRITLKPGESIAFQRGNATRAVTRNPGLQPNYIEQPPTINVVILSRSKEDGRMNYVRSLGPFDPKKLISIDGASSPGATLELSLSTVQPEDMPRLNIRTDNPLIIRGGSFIVDNASTQEVYTAVGRLNPPPRLNMGANRNAKSPDNAKVLNFESAELQPQTVIIESGARAVHFVKASDASPLFTMSGAETLGETLKAFAKAAPAKPSIRSQTGLQTTMRIDAQSQQAIGAMRNDFSQLKEKFIGTNVLPKGKTKELEPLFTKAEEAAKAWQTNPADTVKKAAFLTALDTLQANVKTYSHPLPEVKLTAENLAYKLGSIREQAAKEPAPKKEPYHITLPPNLPSHSSPRGSRPR